MEAKLNATPPYSSRAFQWDQEGGKTDCGLGLTNE
jgi:hypothetical protein